jgi:pyruvate kinase
LLNNNPPALAYEIIATLGPASRDPQTWTAMLAAGATAFRLNTSHLDLDQLQDWLQVYQNFLPSTPLHPVLVLDLQGSKWRLGQFSSFDLLEGQPVDLILAAATDQESTLPVPHADFFAAAAEAGGELILNDAKILLAIEDIQPGRIQARVVQAGPISAHKGITLSTSTYRKENLNDKDRQIFERTRELDFVRYAISYVRDAAEMKHYREVFGPSASLIAKLERQPALDECRQIAENANELWLCRGDLGAEVGLARMAAAAHQFSQLAGSLGVPVILAGQVLEHMTHHPSPTRSELCCLYDALAQGYHGAVLSDETAIGSYPLEAVQAASMWKHA